MARYLRVAAAQLGPIHRADSRQSVVSRLIDMMRQAKSCGSQFVVFPELALTTFFPRYWMEDQSEIESFFEREMPSRETEPLFDEAGKLGVGFHLGYAEMTRKGRRFRRGHVRCGGIGEARRTPG